MQCNLCKEESQLNRISDNIRMVYQKSHTYFFLLLPSKASSSGRKYRRHGLPYLPIGNDVKAAHCSCHHIHWFNFSSLQSHEPSSTLSPKAGFPVTTSDCLLSYLHGWQTPVGEYQPPLFPTISSPPSSLSSLLRNPAALMPNQRTYQFPHLPHQSPHQLPPPSSTTPPTTTTTLRSSSLRPLLPPSPPSPPPPTLPATAAMTTPPPPLPHTL